LFKKFGLPDDSDVAANVDHADPHEDEDSSTSDDEDDDEISDSISDQF
jgi:hypothetical protein